MHPVHTIEQAIEQIKAMKGAIGVDPKWSNRTLSHLENAWATSQHIVRKGSLADTPEANQSQPNTCICPPGGRDITCPAHS